MVLNNDMVLTNNFESTKVAKNFTREFWHGTQQRHGIHQQLT